MQSLASVVASFSGEHTSAAAVNEPIIPMLGLIASCRIEGPGQQGCWCSETGQKRQQQRLYTEPLVAFLSKWDHNCSVSMLL